MENQNVENMSKVKELMENAEKVRLGGALETGVPINFTAISGKVYEGTIVFKKPTMLDYMRMGAIKSEYLRAAGVRDVNLVDDSIKQMAQIMSTLKVVMVKKPEWILDIDKVDDPDLLFHVYYEYEVWENSFRVQRKESTTGDSGTSEREEAVDA